MTARILVVGDVMLDQYLFTAVERLSPEAPVPIARVVRTDYRRGAAANVAANVTSLGGEAQLLCGASACPITKIRVLAGGTHLLRIDYDHAQSPVDLRAYTDALGACSTVVLSDYGKGSLAQIEELIRAALEAGRRVLVDPRGFDYMRYRGVDVFKPNLDEMRVMVGGWRNEGELAAKAQQVRREAGFAALVLTRAGAGLTLYTEEGALNLPSTAAKVCDVTGAGETVIAALAVFLSEGLPLANAAHLANSAAGIACGKFGAASVSRHELGV